MPQQQGMYDEFSANRFLQYIAGLKGLPRKRAAEEIRELLELVGLADSSHRRLGTFSGGMRPPHIVGQQVHQRAFARPVRSQDPVDSFRQGNRKILKGIFRLITLGQPFKSQFHCLPLSRPPDLRFHSSNSKNIHSGDASPSLPVSITA